MKIESLTGIKMRKLSTIGMEMETEHAFLISFHVDPLSSSADAVPIVMDELAAQARDFLQVYPLDFLCKVPEEKNVPRYLLGLWSRILGATITSIEITINVNKKVYTLNTAHKSDMLYCLGGDSAWEPPSIATIQERFPDLTGIHSRFEQSQASLKTMRRASQDSINHFRVLSRSGTGGSITVSA